MSDPESPTRHRADDDVEALAAGSFTAIRTPNGDTDLLDASAKAGGGSPPPDGTGTPFSIDDEETEDELPPNNSSASTTTPTGGNKKVIDGMPTSPGMGGDFGRRDSQSESVCSQNTNSGKQGKKLAKLSDKTTKIMSDYQAYLAEIETEFPSGEEGGDDNDPALAQVNAARENVRGTYHTKNSQEGGAGGDAMEEGLTPIGEDGMVSGAKEQLARAWDWSKGGVTDKLSINRTGGIDEEDLTDFDFEQQMSLERGQKYTHSWIHSRRVRRAIGMVLTGVLLIGLSVGIGANKKKNKDLSALEGQMNAVAQDYKKGSNGGGLGHPGENGVTYNPNDIANMELEQQYQAAVMTYQPLEFDRFKGWVGQTYEEALEFCEERSGYALCPYEAVCPGGDDEMPLGGYRDSSAGDGSAWIPVLDRANDWIQVGSADGCIPYTNMHSGPPEWGLTGKDNEEITENIMCCLGAHLVEKAGYEETMDAYLPKEFDRKQGWKGKTYLQAVDHCRALDEPGYDICPYEAVCPLGPDTEPMGGVKGQGEAEMWMPILNSVNDWVQVGPGASTCIAYSHERPEKPDWGVSGDGSDELTQNIMCCKTMEEDIDEEDSDLYELAVQKYHPHWFDRSKGWKGQTFQEGIDFCDSITGYSLCPYEAICPLGPDTPSVSGFFDEDEAWVPTMDSANEWVQLARENSCVQYTNEHHDAPTWGMNGLGDEEITRNILCCALPGATLNENPVVPNQPQKETPEEIPENKPHSAADSILYADDELMFEPEWYDRKTGWTGQSYLEATQFCGRVKEGFALCPLQAICPLGTDSEPIGGYRDEPKGSWAPVLDEGNHWVQVSSENACIAYEDEKKNPTPEWGMTGGNEEITRHIACCYFLSKTNPKDVAPPELVDPGPDPAAQDAPVAAPGEPPEEEMGQYLVAAEKYDPHWYNRNKGWTGQTYYDATAFCAGTKEGYDICPYEAICPLGPDSEPIGGGRGVPLNSWVPISDAQNDWVQISEQNMGGLCIRYLEEQPDGPVWGMSGGNEEATGFLVCCNVQGNGAPSVADQVALEAGSEAESGLGKEPATPVAATTAATPVAATTAATATTTKAATTVEITVPPEVNEDEVPLDQISLVYQTVAEYYKPKWFDRSKGYGGESYLDAFAFCADFNRYMPCPYEAICPLGRGSKPLGGFKDDPSGAWVPLQDAPNEWVQVGTDSPCVQYSHLHPGPPEWGANGGNEELTRHVACCVEPTPAPTPEPTPPPTTPPPTKEPTPLPTSKPTQEPTLKPTPPPTLRDEAYYEAIVTSMEPIGYDRSEGWRGQTYLEALQFCATKESRVPCPYVAYCPLGQENQPLGGIKEGVAWSPLIDSPNAWVQVGGENTCELYSDLYKSPPQWGLTGQDNEDLTRNILCCLEEPLEEPEPEPAENDGNIMESLTEREQIVLDVFKAQWYGREDGYQGGTYLEAAMFCENVGGMELCPILAYCPEGPVSDSVSKPLFLQLEAFPGEQWAPVKPEAEGESDVYVLIGKLNDNPTTTCHTYRHFQQGEMPGWGLDGSRPDLKQAVLCCKDPNYISNGLSNPAVNLDTGSPAIADEDSNPEIAIANDLTPQWLGYDDGWYGGSHQDAEEFCGSRGGRRICPYAAYCPHGPGQPVSSGHSVDFTTVQWAPVFGHENHWVMVGQKHGNSATTCFGYEDLEGEEPAWGLDSSEHLIKKHIMCCGVGDR